MILLIVFVYSIFLAFLGNRTLINSPYHVRKHWVNFSHLFLYANALVAFIWELILAALTHDELTVKIISAINVPSFGTFVIILIMVLLNRYYLHHLSNLTE